MEEFEVWVVLSSGAEQLEGLVCGLSRAIGHMYAVRQHPEWSAEHIARVEVRSSTGAVVSSSER